MNRRTSLATFDPFADVFPHVLRGFAHSPRQAATNTAASMRIDVKEADNSYVVYADMPGVAKEDINVEIDGATVSISGSVRKPDTNESDKSLRTERYAGTVSRSFELATEIDEDASGARYENGVLELTLPKKAAATARRLAIN